MNKIEELKNEYERVCNNYVQSFCDKQEIEFEGWVNYETGGIAYCGDFYFNFHDIVLDVNTMQENGVIVRWYSESLDNPRKSTNYYSFIKRKK